MEWMILPLRRYFDFEGRSRRMEFWMFQLLNFIVSMVLMVMIFASFPWAEIMADPQTKNQIEDPAVIFEQIGVFFWVGMVLMMIWGFGVMIPNIAVTIRRLHDRDMSGWWYGGLLIAGFIPLVNFLALFGYIALFVVLILPGTDGPNRFGADPKDPGQAGIFS